MPYGQSYPKYSDANLRGEFFRMFEIAQLNSPLNAVTMRVDSDQAFETYGWIGNAPKMREWQGSRQVQEPLHFEWTIYNKLYESTIGLPIDDIRRDKTGNFVLWARSMAQKCAQNPMLILSDLMAAGESALCYDGQYFFDTDHSEGSSGTQSNIATVDISDLGTGGTPTKPSVETMELAIDAGIEAFANLKDNNGDYINQSNKNFVIVSGLGHRSAIRRATSLQVMEDGRQNILTTDGEYTFQRFTDPRLGWTDKFAMFITDDPIKPFVHQVELDTEITYITNPESEEVFRHRRYVWGATRLEGLGFGDYKKAMLIKLQA
jgi:phage major head subunit gpT-like protein